MQVSAVLDSGAAEAYAQAKGTSVAQLRAATAALPEVAALKSARARSEAVDAILAEEIAKNATLLSKNKQIRQAIDTYNGVKPAEEVDGAQLRALLEQELEQEPAQQAAGIAEMEKIF